MRSKVENVAPYVGAWIETSRSATVAASRQVAPYVGAWIETYPCRHLRHTAHVAPYVGAWIETSQVSVCTMLQPSHPTWVRGLKLFLRLLRLLRPLSHPTWVRGLKLCRVLALA